MTDKSNFTPDEWKLLLESVMTAGIAVTAADPSGLWGSAKGEFRERYGTGEGQNGSRNQRTHQSSRQRFR